MKCDAAQSFNLPPLTAKLNLEGRLPRRMTAILNLETEDPSGGILARRVEIQHHTNRNRRFIDHHPRVRQA